MVDFLVMGNSHSFTYKELWPLFMDQLVCFGVSDRIMDFDYEGSTVSINSCWFTTFKNNKNNNILELTKKYSEDVYKKYDNYDAINVDRTQDIPFDYFDVMGVPVTFIFFWNPSQFDILGMLTDNPADNRYTFNGTPTYTDERHHKSKCGVMDGRRCYNKLLIRRKQLS